jgi:hypothetical protein
MVSTTQGKGWTLSIRTDLIEVGDLSGLREFIPGETTAILVGVSSRGERLTMVLTAEEMEAARSEDDDVIRAILDGAPPERITARRIEGPRT